MAANGTKRRRLLTFDDDRRILDRLIMAVMGDACGLVKRLEAKTLTWAWADSSLVRSRHAPSLWSFSADLHRITKISSILNVILPQVRDEYQVMPELAVVAQRANAQPMLLVSVY